MAFNINLIQYQILEKNEVLKITCKGEVIYAKSVLLGEMRTDTVNQEQSDYKGIFSKIKDMEVFKKDRYNSVNLEYIPIDTTTTDTEIEIVVI